MLPDQTENSILILIYFRRSNIKLTPKRYVLKQKPCQLTSPNFDTNSTDFHVYYWRCGEPGEFDYSDKQPNKKSFLRYPAILGGVAGFTFQVGLSTYCITTVIHLLSAGDHVVSADDIYGGSRGFFRTLSARFGTGFQFHSSER